MILPLIGLALVALGIQHVVKKGQTSKVLTSYTTKPGDKPSIIRDRMGLSSTQWFSSVAKLNLVIPAGTVDKTGTFLRAFTFKLPPGITDKGARTGAMGTFA